MPYELSRHLLGVLLNVYVNLVGLAYCQSINTIVLSICLLQIFALQIKCFHEIITIGYIVYRSHNLPWFRTLSWYFLFASNYFFYGESMIHYFGVLLARQVSLAVVQIMITYLCIYVPPFKVHAGITPVSRAGCAGRRNSTAHPFLGIHMNTDDRTFSF